MKFVFPNMQYKEKALEFIQEFYVYDSEIHGSGGLNEYLKDSTYEEWIRKVSSDIDLINIKNPSFPSLTYFYVREEDDVIVGMINIRLALNDFLRNEGGHIGYCIRPTERKKHYATKMLQDALRVYDMLDIKEVLIACYKENEVSSRIIKRCGGVLKKEFYSETFGKVLQMYLINR